MTTWGIVLKEVWSFIKETYLTDPEVKKTVKKPMFHVKLLGFISAIVFVLLMSYDLFGYVMTGMMDRHGNLNDELTALDKKYWILRDEKFKLTAENEKLAIKLNHVSSRERALNDGMVLLNGKVGKLETYIDININKTYTGEALRKLMDQKVDKYD